MALSNAERQARYKERLRQLANEARPFPVRVFIPSPEDPDADYHGRDMSFLAMPRIGDEIRHFSEERDYIVVRAGHLEDEGRFIPAVWVIEAGLQGG